MFTSEAYTHGIFLDGFIRTWEADTGKPVAQYWEHSGWVTDFAYW